MPGANRHLPAVYPLIEMSYDIGFGRMFWCYFTDYEVYIVVCGISGLSENLQLGIAVIFEQHTFCLPIVIQYFTDQKICFKRLVLVKVNFISSNFLVIRIFHRFCITCIFRQNRFGRSSRFDPLPLST